MTSSSSFSSSEDEKEPKPQQSQHSSSLMNDSRYNNHTPHPPRNNHHQNQHHYDDDKKNKKNKSADSKEEDFGSDGRGRGTGEGNSSRTSASAGNVTQDTEQLSISEQLTSSSSSSSSCFDLSNDDDDDEAAVAAEEDSFEEKEEYLEEVLEKAQRNHHQSSSRHSRRHRALDDINDSNEDDIETHHVRRLKTGSSAERLRHRRERDCCEVELDLDLDGGREEDNSNTIPRSSEFKDRRRRNHHHHHHRYSYRSPSSKRRHDHHPISFFCPWGLAVSGVLLLLLFVCVVWMMSMAVQQGIRWLNVRGAQHQLQTQIQRSMQRIAKLPIPTSFTILLHGSRLDLLQRSIDHHSQCRSVARMDLDLMTHREELPESLLGHGRGKLVESSKTLTNNKKKNAWLTREAAFLLDEGVLFSCDELERGFRAWRAQPTAIVGLLPCRSCTYPLVSDSAVFVHGLFLTTLSKSSISIHSSSLDTTSDITASFMSSPMNYYSMMSRPTAHDRRHRRRDHDPCAHFEFAAQLASLTNDPPISILTNPVRTVIDSIDESSNEHQHLMNECVRDLHAKFGFHML